MSESDRFTVLTIARRPALRLDKSARFGDNVSAAFKLAERLGMDSTIISVKRIVLQGKRPRVIGRNARLDVHGQYARDPIVTLHTDSGLSGWGWSRASQQDAGRLLGKRISDLFNPETGTADECLMFDFPLWDLAGHALRKPVYEMLSQLSIYLPVITFYHY